MHSIWVPVAVVSGIFLLPLVQWGRTPVNLSKLGLQVGQHVPDFNLKDQNGKSWTLDSIMGPKGAMLVFYRSADW
jgi:peroxiredoxin